VRYPSAVTECPDDGIILAYFTYISLLCTIAGQQQGTPGSVEAVWVTLCSRLIWGTYLSDKEAPTNT